MGRSFSPRHLSRAISPPCRIRLNCPESRHGLASPQFHVGHDDLFETTRYNRRNKRAKSNWQNLSGIDHDDTIENKEKVHRGYLARSKTDSISGVVHAVDLANQAPIFEGSSGNSVNPVLYNGLSPST